MRAQQRVEVMQQDDVGRVVEAVVVTQELGLAHQRLDLLVPVLGQVDLLGLLVEREVARPVLLGLAH